MAVKKVNIQIAPKTVFILIGSLAAVYFVYLILDILIITFVAMLFTAAINPLVTRMESHGVRRGLGIVAVYLIVFAIFIGLMYAVVPPFIGQLDGLLDKINIPPELLQELSLKNINLQNLQILASQANSLPRLFRVITQTASLIFVLLTIFVISFYMLIERSHLHKYLTWVMGDGDVEEQAEEIINKFEHQIGSWVRGELILMASIGILTYVGLLFLNIEYAFPLAVLAGLMEILPNIGPTIAAIPAVIVASLTVSPLMAIAVLALYILVQQLENNLIVPIVMKKAIDINPIVTILLILTGIKLGGVIGALLSIPLFLVAKIIYLQWREFSSHK